MFEEPTCMAIDLWLRLHMVLYCYQPGVRKAREWLVLRLLYIFCVCLSVRPHLSRAQYCVMCYYATVVYHCTNCFWKFVGQSTASKFSFVLPRWQKSGRQLWFSQLAAANRKHKTKLLSQYFSYCVWLLTVPASAGCLL